MSNEERIYSNTNIGGMEEKSFSSKEGESSSSGQEICQGYGRARGWSLIGRWKGRGRRGGFQGIGGSQGRVRGHKSNKKYYYCNKYDHFKSEWKTKISNEGRVSVHYGEEKDSYIIFFSYGKYDQNMDVIWLLDTWCSNHMIDKGDLFTIIKNSYKSKITLGDDKALLLKA